MKIAKKKKWIGVMFILPFLIGFAAFYLIPFLISIFYTFTFGSTKTVFVGFENYIRVFSSPAFQLAVYNTARFILIGVPLLFLISLVLSLLIHTALKRNAVFKTIYLYPMIVPSAAIVMIFQILFSDGGVMSALLPESVSSWLQSDYAFVVLLLLYVWKNCGYNVILISTGLSAIPQEYYENADAEGANGWQKFRRITLPLMFPNFFFVTIISIVNAFKVFREAYLLAGDTPHSSIYMLQHFMNNNFFNLNYQRLSIAALTVFIVIFALLAVFFVILRRKGDVEL